MQVPQHTDSDFRRTDSEMFEGKLKFSNIDKNFNQYSYVR